METEKSSRQELFYEDYFRDIASRHPNFRFQATMMIKACTRLLQEYGVAPQQIAHDEF